MNFLAAAAKTHLTNYIQHFNTIGLNIKVPGITPKEAYESIKRGDVLYKPTEGALTPTKSFTAQIIINYHPGEIKADYSPVFYCGTGHSACKITRLLSKLDKRSGKVIENNPLSIKMGDAAMVEITPMKPFLVKNYSEFPPLGRFAVCDLRTTVAVGVVKTNQKRSKK
jgi:elongation factor 1-alpha